jgi:ubiquinone/menaquinone biosynthesis C-methylase UbiE
MQENIWENEYKDPRLVTLSDKPAKCVKDFTRFLRKNCKLTLSNLNILDLGCGNAKNSIYIYEEGFDNKITGIDISETALKYAEINIKEKNINAKFIKQSIGLKFPFPDNSFDIILDVTSSNSLSEKERKVYLDETYRILKTGGYLFVRALCKDGDANAQMLLKTNPGKEKDTYIMPELSLTERVFSKEDFLSTYSPFFKNLYLEKEIHYTKFNGRSYKRNFWVACFIK